MKLGFWKGWGKPFSVGVGNGVGGVGLLLPFSDSFARADGVLGNGWTGSTWAIASGKAVNTPTQGAELLTNGNMETGDPPSSWTAIISILDSVADERTGGSGAAALSVVNDGAVFGQARQMFVNSISDGLLLSAWGKKVSGASARFSIVNSSFVEIAARNITTGVTWVNVVMSTRATTANCGAKLYNGGNSSGDESRFDDVSLKVATGLYAVRNTGRRNLNIQGTYGALTTGTQLGILSNIKTDLSAGLVAWIDGVNIKLEKWVGTTWTTLITAAQAPAASKLPQIKTTISGANLLVDLLYNGSAIGTQQTVSDAEIVSNTYAGMFSTYSANTIATFSAAANV